MEYKTTLTVTGDRTLLYQAIQSEATEMARSSIIIKKNKNDVTIHITAQDATALRASINTILKLLIVYEKMSAIK